MQAVAIVDHIMQGTLASTDEWFNNPTSQASSHFGVGKDGTIHQYVDLANSAWGNGIVDHPDMSIGWLSNAIGRGINLNRMTVSIEHEGNTGDVMPEAQYQASLYLHQYISQQLGIILDREHIIGHYQIDSVNRPNCPGTGFQWSRLMSDLQQTGIPQSNPDGEYFQETGYWIVNVLPDGTRIGFLDFFKNNGGINAFGLPKTGAYFDPALGRVVQQLEASRLEYHPENPDPYKVERGLVNDELRGV